MSVHWSIIQRCLRHPLEPAIIDDRRAYRRFEVLAGAYAMADVIASRCNTPTVGVLLPTSGAFPMAALAVWILGKTLVPLNYLLKPDELQFVIDDCGTDTILTTDLLLEKLGTEPLVKNLLSLEKHLSRGFPEPRLPARPAEDELATILYTSGTSGKPKGVMLTHGNLTSNIRQIQKHVSFTGHDVFLGVLPQFHSFGLTVLTLLPLTVGCRVVYSARFVPHRISRLIEQHHATVLVAIPSMYGAMLQAKSITREQLSSLEFVVSGAEPLPLAVQEGFVKRFGISISEGYGLTETSPVTNWCRPCEWRRGSVGPAVPGVEIKIVDPESLEPVSSGSDGEVLIAGPNVMQGYFQRDDETSRVFANRFFRTGDIGRVDTDGHLYITGRLKEMLIIGGENVFPREIEEVLNDHAAVSASAVVGKKDPVRGEVPVAFVELVEDSTVNPRDLIVWCTQSLAGYKVPKDIQIMTELPRNPTGKILRRELVNLAQQPAQVTTQ